MPLSLTTVSGNLQSVLGPGVLDGSVQARLVNFSGQPRVLNTNIIATLVTTTLSASDGSFSFTLIGNDLITPANTFYDLQFSNETGKVSGTLSFVISGPTYNIDAATPVIVPPPETSPCACITFGGDPTLYLDNTGQWTV